MFLKVIYRFVTTILFLLFVVNGVAQTLSLDDCIELALQNNKQLNLSRLQTEVASNMQKAARTKYLPKIDAIAGYELTSKEISLLNNKQKTTLNNLGTSLTEGVVSDISEVLTRMVSDGLIDVSQATELSNRLGNITSPITENVNNIGKQISNAFRTDTRQIFAGSIMMRLPLYMGGAISAYNKMADIQLKMADIGTDMKLQTAIFDVENAYWLVVSLKQKEVLVNSYYELVRKLNDDIQKMISEGVATKADGLNVEVKLGEAEIQKLQVGDGLSLSKMLLCQLCGLPMDSEITLQDEVLLFEEKDLDNNLEENDEVANSEPTHDIVSKRPEIQLLQQTIDLSKQAQRLITAAYRPQVLLTGGYLVTNPNVLNGFERKFGGLWNVGLLLRVPLWNWQEGKYKSQAAKTTTSMAELELDDLREKIELQISQCRFKKQEAIRKYEITKRNILSADENLRCANIGFQEGVIDATTVMTAQTAWQQARTNHIDAQIEYKLAELNLQKAEGMLRW